MFQSLLQWYKTPMTTNKNSSLDGACVFLVTAGVLYYYCRADGKRGWHQIPEIHKFQRLVMPRVEECIRLSGGGIRVPGVCFGEDSSGWGQVGAGSYC